MLLAVADFGAHAAFLASNFTPSRSTPSTSHANLLLICQHHNLRTAIVKNVAAQASVRIFLVKRHSDAHCEVDLDETFVIKVDAIKPIGISFLRLSIFPIYSGLRETNQFGNNARP